MSNRKVSEWVKGEIVKVGFMTLEYTGAKLNNFGCANSYRMIAKSGKEYWFTPHRGIEAI